MDGLSDEWVERLAFEALTRMVNNALVKQAKLVLAEAVTAVDDMHLIRARQLIELAQALVDSYQHLPAVKDGGSDEAVPDASDGV